MLPGQLLSLPGRAGTAARDSIFLIIGRGQLRVQGSDTQWYRNALGSHDVEQRWPTFSVITSRKSACEPSPSTAPKAVIDTGPPGA